MRCDLNNYEYHLPPENPRNEMARNDVATSDNDGSAAHFQNAKYTSMHVSHLHGCEREREWERERERGDFLMPEMASQQFSQSELARSLSPVSKRNANWPPAVYFSQWNDVFVSCSSPAVSRLANSSRMPTFRKRTLWCRRRPNPVSN